VLPSFCALLAHRALNPPPSSSLAEERTPPLPPPPCGGARFPTLAERFLCSARASRSIPAYFVVVRRRRACLLSPSCIARSARRGWRSFAAAFLTRSQTKRVSAPSLVQDSGAPAWLSTAARDFRRSQSDFCALLAHRALNPPPSSSLADEERVCSLRLALLAPLAEAGARSPLPSSLARRRNACLLPRSSRTAARQPGSAWRRAISDARRASFVLSRPSVGQQKPQPG
jgi:hypothetical protein